MCIETIDNHYVSKMHVLSDFSTIGFNELKNRPKWRKKPNSSTSTGLQKDTFADINRNAIVQKKC